MRLSLCAGVVLLVVVTAFSSAQETKPKKEPPFEELPLDEFSAVVGNWQTVISTANGWTGPLRATATLKRIHFEASTFHTQVALTYDLRNEKAKKPAPVRGSETIALFPYRKGKQRYVHILRDHQVLQREYLTEVLDLRPGDKKARQGLAQLRPSAQNTAAYTLSARTWTLEVAPIVREFLPKQVDWDGKITWRKTRSK